MNIDASADGSGAFKQDLPTVKFDDTPPIATDGVMLDSVESVKKILTKLIAFLKLIPSVTDLETERKNLSNLSKTIILLREQSGNDFSL